MDRSPSSRANFKGRSTRGAVRPFAGQVLWNKTWGGMAGTGEPPPPLSAPLPPVFYQLGRRKIASLSSSQKFTPQQEKESVGFTPVRLVGLAAHSFPDGKKRVGRLSAQISPVLRQWETDPTKVQNHPCWPSVTRFWPYNSTTSPIRPRHWIFSSRLGLFYFHRKERRPASGLRTRKKSKKE